jgi:hypothetical protein
VLDRIELAHAGALVRLRDGKERSAERLLESGLELLDEYRAGLGAVELRVMASGMGAELSQLGLRIALRSGDPGNVLSWAERLRGNALRLPPVRPVSDPELRACQSELRRLSDRARKAEQRGKLEPGLAARQHKLELTVRARTRHAKSNGVPALSDVRATTAERALGDRALVEYVEVDGLLHALTLVRGRLALHELSGAGVASELEWLRFALAQLVRRGISPGQRGAALANGSAAAAGLDRLLIEPLHLAVGDAPLVIVPTGQLHALPWAALPSLRGRPIVVAPSLAVWLDLAVRRRSRRRRAVLIAGPRLRHASAEVRSLAQQIPGAVALHGQAATVAATLASLDGAALAHVACHGRFRADSPLFSSLELADGPLTALDLQQLRQVPEVLVLSSCDLALSDLQPGDELLGLSAALFAMGARTIVASVVPVPDAASRRLMLEFHRAFAGGLPPAGALARAHAGLPGESMTLAGFVCLGSG